MNQMNDEENVLLTFPTTIGFSFSLLLSVCLSDLTMHTARGLISLIPGLL